MWDSRVQRERERVTEWGPVAVLGAVVRRGPGLQIGMDANVALNVDLSF